MAQQGRFTVEDVDQVRPQGMFRPEDVKTQEPPSDPSSPGGLGTTTGRFIYGAAVEPIKGFADLLISFATEGPLTTAKNVGAGLLEAQGREGQQAQEALQRGEYGKAIAHGAAWLVPVLGPAVSDIVEEGARTGDWATATGRLTSLGAPLKTPRGATVGGRVTKPLRPVNPAEASAVEFGFREGIPMSAGTTTGSPVVRGAEWMARRTGGGELATRRFPQGQATKLQSTGDRLASQANPSQVSPTAAGASLRGSLERSIEQSGREATTAYDALRAIESSPQAQRTIRTGTRTENTGVLNAQGQPVTRTVPVTEQMGMPVDLRSAKRALKPVYERWIRQQPVTIQRSSPGFKALENIVKGPDYSPASVVDADLSAIKSILREGDDVTRDVSQGFAASSVSQLERAVQKAVTEAGPDAVKALDKGRAATRAKHDVADLLRDLTGRSDEPRRAFDASLWQGDKSLARLHHIKSVAPDELPKLGRAYLDTLLEKAGAEGGFSRSQSLWGEWQKLGRQTKQMLYGAQLTKDLDDFFMLAKKIAENPNPSGSAYGAWLGAQGTYIVMDPIMGTAYQIVPAVMARLMTNQRALKALNEGLKLGVRADKAARVGAFGQLLRHVGEYLEPVEASVAVGAPAPQGSSR